MPLDITLFRKEGGNPDLIRESQRRRFASVELVDEIIAKDDLWRSQTGHGDFLRKERNAVQKEIANIKKTLAQKKATLTTDESAQLNGQCDAFLADKVRLDGEIERNEVEVKQLKAEVDALVSKVGNIVHPDVPTSNNEDADNRVERRWGTPRDPAGLLNHHDLLWRIGGYEPERGGQVVGHRGYFLRDVGVLLNQAFINYGIAFLRARGYCVLQPPYMMKKDVMAGVAQLEQFDEELYKVVGGNSNGEEDKYLIATSEQPICAYHKDEWMDEKQLPLFYAGISTCFRKEAGSHGKDTWGIFRVHQFEKVEQFALVEGDENLSNQVQEDMIRTAEEFYQSLGFPYHVINIVSGALNNAAIRKYDLECWFPGYNAYRELVSCSNCTDYQSRAMEIRCGQSKTKQNEKKYVHMLNATLCATGRAICCLLENYQEADGVRVPEVLVPFMGGITFLPFVRESKIDVAAAAATAKKGSSAAPAAPAAPAAAAAAKPVAPASAPSTSAAATTAAAAVDKKDETGANTPPPAVPAAKKEENKKEENKKEKKDNKDNNNKKKEKEPVFATTPAEVRPPPAYVSPAPTLSSQILGVSAMAGDLSTENVPNVLQLVSLREASGVDVVSVNVALLEKRLSFYSYVGGDAPSAWDKRVFEFVRDHNEVLSTADSVKSVQRWFRHVNATAETVRASW